MWWPHKHAYRGPKNIFYTPILREQILEYVCRCGYKVKVFEDGEILGVFNGSDFLLRRNETKCDGSYVSEFVQNFDVKKTKRISEKDISIKMTII